jgi:hypothetical protein
MRNLRAFAGALFLLAGTSAAQAADKYLLKEKWELGDQWRTTLAFQLNGELQMRSGEKVLTLALAAQAEHRFAERLLGVDAAGQPSRAARFYEEAKANITVQGAGSTRTLRPDRRLQVAQRVKDSTVTYSPAGPLSREEVELTGEHLDVLVTPMLLPDMEVAVGESWDVSIPAVQALVGLDGVVSEEVKGKLESVQSDVARISFTGPVEGISNGAEMKASISATGIFDLKAQRITSLQWRQKEERQQGPVSQTIKAEGTTTMTRTLGGKAAELSDAIVGQLPPEPGSAHLILVYKDAKGRFQFLHERGWHIVAQNDQYSVLRLMDKGELVGQVNVIPWGKEKPGQHVRPEELQKLIEQGGDFAIDRIVQSGAVPAEKGYWVYRISAVGKTNEMPVLQTYYAISGPSGDQVMLIFTTEVSLAERLGGQDLSIVGTVTFPAGK